ncbi:rCG25468, isoform CRA_d [Rattus norvegicus]|uniref:RCG25468, isoform CRA_d n=1 Tax=Rattus norvegicus TaxID=10116 RepID=A6I404_RAT|nr:rCG25468, isoform CRA_d [Rattus norvegicus]
MTQGWTPADITTTDALSPHGVGALGQPAWRASCALTSLSYMDALGSNITRDSSTVTDSVILVCLQESSLTCLIIV